MRITDLLANNGYILFNKALARMLGTNEAILIGELAQEYNYYAEKGLLDDGWFYSTVENIEKATTLTGRQQRPALQHLIDIGIIEVENRGIPCTRYFRLNESQLLQNVTTCCNEMSLQEVTKCNANNNKNNNENSNKQYIRSTKSRPTSVDEVREYCEERNNCIDAEKFFSYYESNGWKVGKNPMKDWKAAIRTWERNKSNEYDYKQKQSRTKPARTPEEEEALAFIEREFGTN